MKIATTMKLYKFFLNTVCMYVYFAIFIYKEYSYSIEVLSQPPLYLLMFDVLDLKSKKANRPLPTAKKPTLFHCYIT